VCVVHGCSAAAKGAKAGRKGRAWTEKRASSLVLGSGGSTKEEGDEGAKSRLSEERAASTAEGQDGRIGVAISAGFRPVTERLTLDGLCAVTT
jgi:hypothetical protein